MFAANDSPVTRSSIEGPSIGIDTGQSGTSFCYTRAVEIYGENEPAEYLYQVTEGAVRSYKLLSDGRRQIGAFHLAGDVFGFESGPVHRFTAEAIVDTRVRSMKRSSLNNAANNDPLLVHNLLETTAKNLRHAEDHMLLLGRKSANRTRGDIFARDGSTTGRPPLASDEPPGAGTSRTISA
jgi:CRP/FNR family transcriptional regulator, nitrogen fixation regulation protein